MSTLILYFICLGFGGLFGYLLKKKGKKKPQFLGNLQIISTIVLLFTMGIGIGLDKNIFNALPFIGTLSLLYALSMLFFTVLFVFLIRKFLNINKKGELK